MIDSKSCDNESDLMAHRHYVISKSLVDWCRIVITTVIAGGLTSDSMETRSAEGANR